MLAIVAISVLAI